MRSIDRIELLEEIGRTLQSRMTFADIDVFFSGFDIDCRGASSGRGSKRLYASEILANTSDDKILQISDELGIPHTYHSQLIADEGSFWDVGHFRFRLFLSHVAPFKDKAAYLEKRLRDFGISAFVAHQDIEPTKEWLVEIEKALFSMDTLAALLTPGFADSHWTDHEVGVAIGRCKSVIPILKGQIPYGFIGKYQGLQGEGKSVSQVAGF